MTKLDFLKKIENGSDIMFDVLEKHYTILTWPEEGIAIGQQGIFEEPQYFGSPEALLEGFEVDGFLLADLCDKIVITDYS